MRSHSIRLAVVSEELRSQNLEPAINIEIIIIIIQYDNTMTIINIITMMIILMMI